LNATLNRHLKDGIIPTLMCTLGIYNQEENVYTVRQPQLQREGLSLSTVFTVRPNWQGQKATWKWNNW